MEGLPAGVEGVPEGREGTAQLGKSTVKQERGRWSQGRPRSPNRRSYQGPCGQTKKMTKPRLSPSAFWNEDLRFRWLDAANVGQAYIDGILTTSLIDGGTRMNLNS